MRILITGGAGFIGSNFVYYLLDKHPEDMVICVDCLTYAGNMSTLSTAMKDPRFSFHKTDICDRNAIYEIFEKEKPEIVVNFAAESHVDRSIEKPEVFLRTNILGTQVMMDACRKYGIKRFHQFIPGKSICFIYQIVHSSKAVCRIDDRAVGNTAHIIIRMRMDDVLSQIHACIE